MPWFSKKRHAPWRSSGFLDHKLSSRVWNIGKRKQFFIRSGELLPGNLDWTVSLVWGLHSPRGKGKTLVRKGTCLNQQKAELLFKHQDPTFYVVSARLWVYDFRRAGIGGCFFLYFVFPEKPCHTITGKEMVKGDFYTSFSIVNAN